MVMKHFNRLSDWIDIEYKESDKRNYMKGSFSYQGKDYRLTDFTKIHYNPWFGSDEGYPQYITAIQRDPEGIPLFIEVNETQTQLRMYTESPS